MNDEIYLDHAATTPVDPRVAAAMADCLTSDGIFANPASQHAAGAAAAALVEKAREQVAALIGAPAAAIIWTSGATESINLAVKGAARACPGSHIVSCRTEHSAVIDTCRQLESEGTAVTWLVPDRDGVLDPRAVAEAIRPETILVTVLHVNNEIGIIQDVAAITQLCRERGVLCHVDAAQSAGKLAVDVTALGADLLSLSAHKFYGPKGIGALYVRPGIEARIQPLLHGGGQERGLRSGTLATHQVVGMGKACAIAAAQLDSDAERIGALRQRLLEQLSGLAGVCINGDPQRSVAGILNVSFAGVQGESLLLALRDLTVSSGAACASARREPSYVLRALGRDDALAESSVRFSLGRATTAAQIDRAGSIIRAQLARLRALAPAGPGSIAV